MQKQHSFKLDRRRSIFKVGKRFDILRDSESARNFFKQFGLCWKQEFRHYLGTSAKVKLVGNDNRIVLEMHDGKNLVLHGLNEKRTGLGRRTVSNPSIRISNNSAVGVPRVTRSISEVPKRVKAWKVEDLVNGKLSNQYHDESVEQKTISDTLLTRRRGSITMSDFADGASELRKFLLWVKLDQYQVIFLSEGFDTVEDLRNAEMEDFLAIGIKRGHARRLIRALDDWEKISPEDELPSPEEPKEEPEITFSASKPSSLNIIPEYHLSTSDLWDNESMNSSEPSQAHSRTSSKWNQDGCLIIPFEKRPLGFGIMSPLYIGTMVATISDDSLKNKGLVLGLPILCINNFDVVGHNLKSVSSILSLVGLPFTITFGLEPYFKVDQKVMVFKNHKWHPATVKKMSKRTRKVTINYDNNPFRFGNTEKILNYNRIKSPNSFETTAEEEKKTSPNDWLVEERKSEPNQEHTTDRVIRFTNGRVLLPGALHPGMGQDSKEISKTGHQNHKFSNQRADAVQKPTCKVSNQESYSTDKEEHIKIVRKSRILSRKASPEHT